jgi:hypothetical protein
MDLQRFRNLKRRLMDVREERLLRDGFEIPKSIVILEQELANERDPASRYDLYQLMRSEYFEAGLTDLERQTMRLCVRDLPEEPLPWISLAETLRSDPACTREAKEAAGTAVKRALGMNRLVRFALTTQARIAAESGDADVLAQALTGLVEDAPNQREEDGPYDVDFVQNLPENMISASLVQRYLAIAQASGSDRSA